MIKQANESDISDIEEVLLDAVKWMKSEHLENKWNEENVKWNSLRQNYKINDFYIMYDSGVPAGCMAITDEDLNYFPEVKKGNSLYLHKLAVKSEFSGNAFSNKLINYAKELSIKRGINCLRLDCNLQREKLRILYENEGFVYVGSKSLGINYKMALYLWHV